MSKIIDKIRIRLQKVSPIEAFILISLVAGFILLTRYFIIKQEWKIIRIEVIGNSWATSYDPYGYRTPFWLSDKLTKGLVEKNSSGKVIAEIIKVDNYARGDEEAEVYLTVRVKTFFNKKIGKYIFKSRSLDLGMPIDLRPGNLFIPGQIIDVDVPLGGYLTKEVIITCIRANDNPWMFNNIKPGEKMYNRADKSVIAEIINTKLEPPTSSIFLQNGEIINDPKKKDLILTIKAQVFQQDGNWFFAGHQQVKIGNPLSIYTDNFNLGMEIQDFEDFNKWGLNKRN